MEIISRKLKSVWGYLCANQLIIMYMLFAGALITANCIANKMVFVGNWFGEDIYITLGIICYPLTFLITDVIGEKFGRKAAFHAVVGGFVAQVASMALILIGTVVPGIMYTAAGVESTAQSYMNMYGNGALLILGSLAGCVLSQSWDVWIFHKIRDAYVRKRGTTAGGRWIWNNASTMSSQLIDSVVFYAIAFGATVSFRQFVITVGVYWVIKIAIAACDTPFFYLFTGKAKTAQEVTNEQ